MPQLLSLDEKKLNRFFDELNSRFFDLSLPLPVLKWNTRLRTSAGRFIPGSRRFFVQRAPVIEVAAYLLEEQNADHLIQDTMAHEMIHYWLWIRRRPYGHTPEFYKKMKQMGASRYNPVPRLKSFKYEYQCDFCKKGFFVRRKLGIVACAECCGQYSNGRYDMRFKLILARTLR